MNDFTGYVDKLNNQAMVCSKCNDTGFIPLMGKNGKPLPTAKIVCVCQEERLQHEYDYAVAHPCLVRPDDFDFPMSYGMHRALCYEHGWQDPGSNMPTDAMSPANVSPDRPSEPEWTQKQWQYVQQIRAQMLHLSNKVNEMRAQPKRKPSGEYY